MSEQPIYLIPPSANRLPVPNINRMPATEAGMTRKLEAERMYWLGNRVVVRGYVTNDQQRAFNQAYSNLDACLDYYPSGKKRPELPTLGNQGTEYLDFVDPLVGIGEE